MTSRFKLRFKNKLPSCLVALTALALSLGWTTAVSAQAAKPVPARVVGRVSDAQLTPLPGSAPFAALAQSDLGALADDTPLEDMILQLQPSQEQEKALAGLLAAQLDPQSAEYHHWLTPSEFGARFGVAAEDIGAVKAWLQSHGFTVESTPASGRAVVFSGTAGQLRSAFGTELHRYQMAGGVRIANNVNPVVPTALAPVVSALVSLNDSPRVAAHHDLGLFQLDRATGSVSPVSSNPLSAQAGKKTGTALGSVSPEFTATVGTSTYRIVSPYDFATIYDLKPLWNQGIDGTGQTIAIVSRSDLNLSDVDKFRANFGLPAAKVNKIYVNSSPGITADVPETALDVEWSGAVAKGATVDLVIGRSSLTTDGVDYSALYIVNNNVAPIVSMSYGSCELALGQTGNSFYNTLWQQAAAQGQTVFVSSGDAGATTCDQGASYSKLGLSINGLGSTPYNVAVGGTDLYGTYTGPTTYWNTSNDPTTLASALSYVPEIPWDDSCGNTVLLGVLQAKNGYTDTTTAQLCNDSKVNTSNFRNLVGGGGGASSCIATTDGTVATCTGGYPKPSWQTGSGVPADHVRDIPDVSLFAGDGLWGSFYPYCVSSLTQGGVCDLTASTNIQGAGGTSFASPAFAGIMALINQKTAGIQGNANPILYKLAANQTSLDCTIENSSANTACIYHDVDLGGNAMPCFHYDGAKDCVVSASSNTWGVVSGNAAGKGYDLASGLGSVDITNLVDAWPAALPALASTSTALSLSSSSGAYGTGLKAAVTVSSSAGTPTGDFTVLANGQTGRQDSDAPGTLSAGAGTLSLSLMPVGTYPVIAHYAGDGTFGASDSGAQTITISKAATTLAVMPSRPTVTATQASLLSFTVSAAGTGDSPTGSVSVVDTTTGAALGSFALQQGTTAVSSTAGGDVTGTQLAAGSNALTVTYSGDANYAGSTTTLSLAFSAPFTLSASPSSLVLTTGAASTSVSSGLTVTPAVGSALAYPITLSCAGTLPTGTDCTIYNSVITSPATTASLTLSYNPALAANVAPVLPGRRSAPIPETAVACALALGLISRRRKLTSASLLSIAMLFFVPVLVLSGCAGGSNLASSLMLTASTPATALGTPVTFSASLLGNQGNRPVTGSVLLNDTYHGVNRTLGSLPVDITGAGTLSLSTLGLGSHTITAVYGGDGAYPGATSSAVDVVVHSTATLQVTATDASGYKVTIPVGVTLQ